VCRARELSRHPLRTCPGGRCDDGFEDELVPPIDFHTILAAVALPRHFGKARIDHHTLLRQGQSVFLLQMREEGVEQALEGLRFDEPFAEVADGLTRCARPAGMSLDFVRPPAPAARA